MIGEADRGVDRLRLITIPISHYCEKAGSPEGSMVTV